MRRRCYQANDQEPEHLPTWFADTLAAFADLAPSDQRSQYDHVHVIEAPAYYRYPFGNCDCAQGYRHKATGWTFPDLCRQHGGCPEIWTTSNRRQLTVAPASPVLDYIYSP